MPAMILPTDSPCVDFHLGRRPNGTFFFRRVQVLLELWAVVVTSDLDRSGVWQSPNRHSSFQICQVVLFSNPLCTISFKKYPMIETGALTSSIWLVPSEFGAKRQSTNDIGAIDLGRMSR